MRFTAETRRRRGKRREAAGKSEPESAEEAEENAGCRWDRPRKAMVCPTCGRIDRDPLMRVSTFLSAALLLTLNLAAQDADPGRLVFEGRCARCHGADGNGGGPIGREQG